MSAMGQKRTSACLLDELVGEPKHLRWDCDAEFSGGLEVDDKCKLARLFDWQIGRLGALEDLVYINRGALVHILVARSVGHQASDFNELLVCIYVRQPLLFGEIHYTLAIMQENAIRQNE